MKKGKRSAGLILGGVCYVVGGGLMCCADILPSYRPASAPYPEEWVKLMVFLGIICFILGYVFIVWWKLGRRK